MSDENPIFTTQKRAIGADGALQWGGSDGKSWSDAIDTSSGVTVTDTGNVSSGTVIDNFEGSDLSNYIINKDGQGSGSINVQTSTAKEGSHALNIDMLNDTRDLGIASTSGLNVYPQQGDVVRVWMRGSNSDTNACNFIRASTGVKIADSSFEGYHFRMDFNDGSVYIQRDAWSNDSEIIASDTAASISPQNWYELRCQYETDNTLRAQWFDTDGNAAWTQEELQTWVDDTKTFYG